MQGLELLVIVPVVIAPVDSPKGSISPSTFVPQMSFAALSLWATALPVATRGDTLGHRTRVCIHQCSFSDLLSADLYERYRHQN